MYIQAIRNGEKFYWHKKLKRFIPEMIKAYRYSQKSTAENAMNAIKEEYTGRGYTDIQVIAGFGQDPKQN